jgi:hypothetical protein
VALPATQVGVKVTALALVRTGMLVDPFVTDMQSLLPRQPAADLLRTPLLARQALNPLPSAGRNPWPWPRGVPEPDAAPAWGVAAKSTVAPDLAADRGLVPLQNGCDPALGMTCLQKCLNLVAFFLVELCAVSHRRLSCLPV